MLPSHAAQTRTTPVRASAPALASVVRATPSPAPEGTRPLVQTSIHYGPAPYQMLDLYLPDPAEHPGPSPVIVFLHSGGWVGGTRANVSDIATAQLSRGYAVASADYQLATVSPTGQRLAALPGAVRDVDRAVAFLKADAGQFGLDPSRVVLMGTSAGGHLAALTGASQGRLEPGAAGQRGSPDRSVAAIVDVSGITDLPTFEAADHPWAAPLTADLLGCPPAAIHHLTCPPDALLGASVAPYVDSTAPPIFMAYGGRDTLVVAATQAQPLAQLWVRAHGGNRASAFYDLIPDAGHNISAAQVDMRGLDEFLDRATGGATLATRRVVLYGDSLAWEARDPFQNALLAAGVGHVTTETFGGTAICDWLTRMRQDEVDTQPDAVVVEFSGNALTPCMKDRTGHGLTGEAYFEKYTEDTRSVVQIFGPTLVYFIGAPISRRADELGDSTVERLDAIIREVVANHPSARFVDAGAAVTDHGRWRATLPCLPEEPCASAGHPPRQSVDEVVRAPDGAHFCPVARPAVGGVIGGCPVWSSGAYRFGTAMADRIPLDLSELSA